MDFKIIFENEDLLAIDKPPGINSDDFEKRVHRLDKDTSGILLVAKNDEALIELQTFPLFFLWTIQGLNL